MATITITGGTGLIGTPLTKALTKKGHRVIILTRKAKPATGAVSYIEWDIEKQTIEDSAISDTDYIVHLAGANVADGRWTDKRKKEIVESRVQSGELLVQALRKIPNRVKAVISASAIGWYGPDPQVPNPKPFVETDPSAQDFLGTTCRQWEASITPVQELGKRLVIVRTGIVLSNESGAYAEFKKPLGFGAATILGNGKQVVSWIHIDDMVRLYVDAIENETLQGVINGVAPHPVSNQALIVAIAKERGRFFVPVHVPTVGLKLALGEMSTEVLKSTTVSSKKLESTGFTFLNPTIEEAVKSLESAG